MGSESKGGGAAGAALFVLPKADRIGGAERVTITAAVGAARSGRFEEVVLLVLTGGRGAAEAVPYDVEGLRVVHLGARAIRWSVLAWARFAHQRRWSLAFSSFLDVNALSCLLRRTGALRTDVLVTRESTMVFERDFGRWTRVVRGLYWLYGSQDRIVCQTSTMASSLIANVRTRLADKVVVVPNPVSDALIARHEGAKNHSRSTRIAWCGRLAPVKSPERALTALARLHADGRTDVELAIVGDGPLLERLERQSVELGIEGSVEFHGHLDRPADVLETCAVGLVTSDVEGFPNVILEMLAAGVGSVVTTDCAGDLRGLPGVVVTEDPGAETLAEALRAGFERPRVDAEVAELLRSRAPGAFVQRMQEGL